MIRSTIPKAELHCHLEGSITPTLALELAQRNDVTMPEALFAPDGSYLHRDFLSFPRGLRSRVQRAQTPRRLRRRDLPYLAQAAAQGAVYVEMFCSPERPKGLGISYADWAAALTDASIAPGATSGSSAASASSAFVTSGLNARSPWSSAWCRAASLCRGFGMGGDEAKFEPIDFAPAYRLAHEKGYGCTVHAGEVRGPESVWSSIRDLPVTPHRPRRALGGGSPPAGRAGAARHRPRGLPRQQTWRWGSTPTARRIRCIG